MTHTVVSLGPYFRRPPRHRDLVRKGTASPPEQVLEPKVVRDSIGGAQGVS